MGCFPGSDYLIIHLIKFDNMCYPLFLDSLSGNSGTLTLIDDSDRLRKWWFSGDAKITKGYIHL